MSGLCSTNMRGRIKVNEGEHGVGLDMYTVQSLSFVV